MFGVSRLTGASVLHCCYYYSSFTSSSLPILKGRDARSDKIQAMRQQAETRKSWLGGCDCGALEARKEGNAEGSGQTHSRVGISCMHLFPVRRLFFSDLHIIVSSNEPHRLQRESLHGHCLDLQSSSDQQASTTQGFMLHLAAPLTASEVTRMYRTWSVLSFTTITQTAWIQNIWWLGGLLHVHYLLLLILCLLLRSLHDVHVTSTSKRLLAPSCTLYPIYCFSCSITAGALIVRSLKNSRPSPPCDPMLAPVQRYDPNLVLT